MARGRKKKGVVVAVDLGNGTTLVATLLEDGHVEVIVDADGLTATPTLIAFQEGDPVRPLFGRAAGSYGKHHPEHLCSYSKRGRGETDLPGLVDKDGRAWNTEELEVMFVKWRLETAAELLGRPIAGVLATVPACFDDVQRRATQDVFERAGYVCIGLCNEPTGAILGYALGHDGTHAVTDIGAGTLDVSIVTVKDGTTFTILATSGQDDLGGIEFTRLLVNHCVDLAAGKGVQLEPERDLRDLTMLEHACEAAKIELSTQDTTLITFRARDQLLDVQISRAEFEQLAKPLCDQITAHVQHALSQAGLEPGAVDGVIFAGGGSRVPCARVGIEALFGPDKILRDIDPLPAVVTGAVHAASRKLTQHRLAGNTKLVESVPAWMLKGGVSLAEVTGQALGVEAVNTKTEEARLVPIVAQGTPLPASATKAFGVQGGEVAQTSPAVRVMEGEAFCSSDQARLLAEFKLNGLPAGPSEDRIEVTFAVDTNGLVEVHAMDAVSGTELEGRVENACSVNQASLG